MPEDELETPELKEQIDERIEEDLEAREAKAAWIRLLSLSTAMIAVFAAVASLESGSHSNEAILEKSEAMLDQARASDQWAYFQAKGVKSAIASSNAELIADTKPTLADKLRADAKRYKAEGDAIEVKAKEFEEGVERSNTRSEDLMEHHHKFAISVTLLQIAIALSAIAALTRKKPLWFLGLAVSAGGLVMFVRGFL